MATLASLLILIQPVELQAQVETQHTATVAAQNGDVVRGNAVTEKNEMNAPKMTFH